MKTNVKILLLLLLLLLVLAAAAAAVVVVVIIILTTKILPQRCRRPSYATASAWNCTSKSNAYAINILKMILPSRNMRQHQCNHEHIAIDGVLVQSQYEVARTCLLTSSCLSVHV
jgi:hypothetical protein